MHLQTRSKSANVMRFGPGKDGNDKEHIKNMPVDFAKEIVTMWHEFACALERLDDEEMRCLGRRAHEVLGEAKAAAEAVRTNDVTKCQIAQRKKEGKLKPDFEIDPIEWPV